MSVRRTIMRANPIPEQDPHVLGARAQGELAGLVGEPGAAPSRADGRGAGAPAGRPRRVPRLALVAVAGVAAVLVGVAAVALLGGGAAPPSSADEPFYATTAELEASADLVVRGTLGAGSQDTDAGYPQTRADVAVTHVARGDAATGDTVTVAYTTPGSGPETATGLVEGREYVLLLSVAEDGTGYLVSSVQGYYAVEDGGRLVAAPGNDVTLSPATTAALGL
ncbi:hypothetical protein [Cellulomonas cellasea]|nr:hypothetical protein [Cellulomonas cellasea]